jgi:hypothetical protein
MMGVEELGELADDIMLNGLHQPIVLYQGQILDGRNRYQACELAGIEPDCTEYEGDDPLGYVLSLNLHRRHLTASQRAALAAEIANMTQGDGTHKSNLKQGRSAKISEATSQAEAAEKLDVSPAYIREAKKIQRESPEHFDQVKSGELSLQQAKRELQPEPATSTGDTDHAETPSVVKVGQQSGEQGLADRHFAKPLEEKAPTLDGGRQIIRSIQQVDSDMNSSDVNYLAETLIQAGLADTYDQMIERVIARMMEIKREIKMAESRLGPDGEQPIFPGVQSSDQYKKNRDVHQTRFHREI